MSTPAASNPSPTALPQLQDNFTAAGLRAANIALLVPPASVVPVEVPGMRFRVLESDAPLQIRYDSGPFVPHDVGTEQVLPAPMDQNGVARQTYFKRLEVRNTSLVTPSNVVLFVGTDAYNDNRLNLVRLAQGKYLPIMEGSTRVAAWPNASLGATTAVAFDGATPADGGNVLYRDVKRQSIIVANLDPASSLLIRDAATHTPCGVVFPNTEILLPISEAVEVYNFTAAAMACYIMEIWTTAKVTV